MLTGSIKDRLAAINILIKRLVFPGKMHRANVGKPMCPYFEDISASLRYTLLCLLLSLVKSGVITCVVPRHHEIFERLIFNCFFLALDPF